MPEHAYYIKPYNSACELEFCTTFLYFYSNIIPLCDGWVTSEHILEFYLCNREICSEWVPEFHFRDGWVTQWVKFCVLGDKQEMVASLSATSEPMQFLTVRYVKG
jgi:hypothetical protein